MLSGSNLGHIRVTVHRHEIRGEARQVEISLRWSPLAGTIFNRSVEVSLRGHSLVLGCCHSAQERCLEFLPRRVTHEWHEVACRPKLGTALAYLLDRVER